jgi:hypothetical protein
MQKQKIEKMVTTAHYNTFYSNIQLLPEQIQIQIFDYVQYLVLKYYTTPPINLKKDFVTNNTEYRQFGKFKGKIRLSDDFNEPMDDFKEY